MSGNPSVFVVVFLVQNFVAFPNIIPIFVVGFF